MTTESSDRVAQFILPGPPIPAPRPRFRVINTRAGGQFVHVYYAGKYKDFLAEAPDQIAKLASLDAPLDGPLRLHVTFYVTKPKTTKRSFPRYDLDNYLKSIMDAMTKAGIWHDDDQVVSVVATKSFGDPRTDVRVEGEA